MRELIEIKQQITSVKKFLEIKERYLYVSEGFPERWIYRGLSDFAYPLIPSVGRLFGKPPFLQKDKLFAFEKDAFSEFIISTSDKLRESNHFTILAVAKHLGLKTRLLDWTFSPLIALFFAVENEKKSEIDGSLTTFQPDIRYNKLPDRVKSPFDNRLEDYHLLFLPSLTTRIKAQQGIFLLSKDPTIELSGDYLIRLKIPSQSKLPIKMELEELGISYKTVYPDFDGLCKSINYNRLRNR
jgi:hypothetical protein